MCAEAKLQRYFERDKYNLITATLHILAPLCTGIPRDISRGIRHDVILFRLYYDAKECTFTGYARNGAAETSVATERAALLINLSRGRAKKGSE